MQNDLGNVRRSTTTRINHDTVSHLRQTWQFTTDDGVSSAPIVVSGRAYVADWGGSVYAVDVQDGHLLWKKHLQDPETSWMWHGFCGTGILTPDALVEASTEGYAFGLDPATGDLLWKERLTDQRYAGSICDILYHDGLVYLGLSSVEEVVVKNDPSYHPVFRGQVIALDQRTGKKAWTRDLVEAPRNGVAVWSSFALDPDSNSLYFDTGNNYSGEASSTSDALIAVDAKSGAITWVTQTWENDVWDAANNEGPDFDFGAGPQLFEATIDGRRRKLVGAGQKSGVYWAFDRENGQPVWKTVVSYAGNLGGMQAEASIGEDAIYCWGNNHYMRVVAQTTPEQAAMNVVALDPATGRRRWWRNRVQPAGLWSSGILANDVYIVGTQTGHLQAFHATDGKTLWTHANLGSVNAPLVVDDETLYVGTSATAPMTSSKIGNNGLTAFRLNHG